MMTNASPESWTVHDWAKEIRAVYRKTVAASIEIGQLLLEAKRQLGHGKFLKIYKDLQFDDAMGKLYMKVASNPVLANPKHVWHLPTSIGSWPSYPE